MAALNEQEYLFVYGTLRNDTNHKMYRFLAQHAGFVGDAEYRGKLYDMGEYPGAVPSVNPSDVIKGELYVLRDPALVLRVLDKYEGCGPVDPALQEFCRERAKIILKTGEHLQAWIYLFNQPTDGLKVVPSGDYLESVES